jgi:hypothetical protein
LKNNTLLTIVIISMLMSTLIVFEVETKEITATGEHYLRLETPKIIFLIYQPLIDNYGQETFSKLLNLVDERFDKIMNITNWSSERFYEHKLEVTVDPMENPMYEGNPIEGFGADGYVNIQIGTDFISSNETLNTVEGFPSWTIYGFLHEMTHGITPSTILNRRWLCEGYACFLSTEAQVSFGDMTRVEADDWYDRSWERYVGDGFVDFHFSGNRKIQDGWGYFITAWMLNNITENYGWMSHQCFFESLPEEYLVSMPSFIYSHTENSTYAYCFDSLIVGYYSLAVGESLFGKFKSWGVESLPNPITVISLTGDRNQVGSYISQVIVSLNGFGENSIEKTEYSHNKRTWTVYSEPVSILHNGSRFLYFRSIDTLGNIGPTGLITISVQSEISTTEPFPIALVSILCVIIIFSVITFIYFKKRKR